MSLPVSPIESRIRALTAGCAWDVRVLDTVTSTNDVCRSLAEQGAPAGTAVLARQQTAGRGRQGRAFFSPEHTGLYCSVLLRPTDHILAITPMAAVAAAEAVEACTGQPVQIKWVNDLFLRGRKICGILAEAQFTGGTQSPAYVILGIGINLLEPPGGFPPALSEIAGAIYPAGTTKDADTLFAETAAALLSALERALEGLPEKQYLAGYKSRLCVLHRPITVLENGTETPAEAIAVDDDLRLLVRYPDGRAEWRATGEIRIRL